MKEKLEAIRSEAISKMKEAASLDALNEIRVKYLGKKGELTEVGDGKITLEEFFGVNSLDEVKPIII